MTQKSDKRVCLGVITSAHGIRGEVKIKPFTQAPDGPAGYGSLQDETGTQTFEIVASRVAGNILVARLKGVGDRNAAEALKGTKLYARRENLPEPEEDSWYFTDLIGLSVYDQGNEKLGRISAVHNFGAGDILEIVSESHGTNGMLAFTLDDVPEIDIAAGRITIIAPDDLFKIAEKEQRHD